MNTIREYFNYVISSGDIPSEYTYEWDELAQILTYVLTKSGDLHSIPRSMVEIFKTYAGGRPALIVTFEHYGDGFQSSYTQSFMISSELIRKTFSDVEIFPQGLDTTVDETYTIIQKIMEAESTKQDIQNLRDGITQAEQQIQGLFLKIEKMKQQLEKLGVNYAG